jgi:hypothetical protein
MAAVPLRVEAHSMAQAMYLGDSEENSVRGLFPDDQQAETNARVLAALRRDWKIDVRNHVPVVIVYCVLNGVSIRV